MGGAYACRSVLLLFFVVCGGERPYANAQPNDAPVWVDRLSFTASLSNSGHATDHLYDYSLRELVTIGPGEFSVSYRLSDALSLGLGLGYGLGNPEAGFFDAAGTFFPLQRPGRRFARESALLFLLSSNPDGALPVFVEFGIGYAPAANAPAFTGLLGVRFPLYHRLSVTGGLRGSYVAHHVPPPVAGITTFGALRLEVGLNWAVW